jgi:CRISPR/Cas system-associated exonuclease Cas4 (RecB family)
MEYINKTVFINYLNCPTLAWLTKRNKIPKLTGLKNDFLIYEGKNIIQKAWQLFNNSVVVYKFQDIDVFLQTKNLIENYKIDVICNASFVAEGSYYVRADILKRIDKSSWHLFEVKFSSKCKEKYTNDIAFTAMVLSKANINVSKYSILHLSNDYRLDMQIESLFKEIDFDEKVNLRLLDFFSISEQVLKDVNSDNMPKPFLKRRCKNCPVFDICMGKNIKNHIFDLPILSIPAMEELIILKADTIEKVPDDFELTQMQQIVKNSVLTNTTYVSDTLQDELNNIKSPYYYLDFESVTTIMPLYPDVAPYTQILTQFSLDKTDNVGNILNHYEYIADHTKDCRRKIAIQLIDYLKQYGSIITYSNSERISILELANLFQDLREKLNKIADRIVDLELILKKNYYDVNFHGRSSIKKVLPILIPKETYLDLEICDGGDAGASFAFMAMGMYDKNQIEQTKKNLLKYCAKDTAAMIYIHQFLINVTKNNCIK